MSPTLLRDIALCLGAFLVALYCPLSHALAFWFEGAALYVLAMLQERIDRGLA